MAAPEVTRAAEGVERRTRHRVLAAAIGLLAREGWADHLLDRAAAGAGCAPEQAGQFFRRDEELILALYARLAADLESRVLELPQGTVAERFQAVMLAKFDLAAPYRQALAALSASLLDPRHEMAVLGPQTEIIRHRVLGIFAAVVQGASDCPPAANSLARTLYGIHLGLMLLWSQDRTPDGRAARGALDLLQNLLAFAGPFLGLPEAEPLRGRLDGILRPLLDPGDDAAITERARAILLCLFRHRRLLPQAGSCASAPCEQCLALHLPRVSYFLRAGQPIHFLLPAFPAKSPSRRKTLGPLPDKGEVIALGYLDGVCEELHALHPAGVRLTICSDGHVFSDVVGVGDEEVTHYGQEIESLIRHRGLAAIDTFSMGDLYEGLSFPEMREELTTQYAHSLEALEERAHRFDHVRSLVDGIHRFLFEEQADVHPEQSRTQLRKECRRRAYRVVQRSDAWGRLLADCFPLALRLSIHPQHPHAEKIGILLGAADDAWLTPWHGVAVHHPAGWKYMKRFEAEALGARLIEENGRPSHFDLTDPPS